MKASLSVWTGRVLSGLFMLAAPIAQRLSWHQRFIDTGSMRA